MMTSNKHPIHLWLVLLSALSIGLLLFSFWKSWEIKQEIKANQPPTQAEIIDDLLQKAHERGSVSIFVQTKSIEDGEKLKEILQHTDATIRGDAWNSMYLDVDEATLHLVMKSGTVNLIREDLPSIPFY